MSDEITARDIVRAEMLQDRGRELRCDLCGTPRASQMHEIVSRGRTVKNDDARALSFDKRLCSILCESCHLTLAHTKAIRDILLQVNYRRYGYTDVASGYYGLEGLLITGLDFALPSPMRCTPARPIRLVDGEAFAPVHCIERCHGNWQGIIFLNAHQLTVTAPHIGDPMRVTLWTVQSIDERD